MCYSSGRPVNYGSKVDHVASQSVEQAGSWLSPPSLCKLPQCPLHSSSLLYRIPVFCSQEDDDGDFGGGFMDWSPSPSPVSTLTHYIHNNKSEMIFLAYPNLYCQAY